MRLRKKEIKMKTERELFEKLPEIRDSISEHIVFIGNKYTTPNPDFYDLVNWLNGAWYAFQEQQEKIARLQSRIDGAMDFYNTAKSDVNIGMMRMAQYLKGEVK